jgi:hypothetical protein
MDSQTTRQGAKIMKNFTKNVIASLTETQKDALRNTVILTANHLVNAESRDITLNVTVHPIYSDRVVAVLTENVMGNEFKRQYVEIGSRGKIISNDLFN